MLVHASVRGLSVFFVAIKLCPERAFMVGLPSVSFLVLKAPKRGNLWQLHFPERSAFNHRRETPPKLFISACLESKRLQFKIILHTILGFLAGGGVPTAGGGVLWTAGCEESISSAPNPAPGVLSAPETSSVHGTTIPVPLPRQTVGRRTPVIFTACFSRNFF